VRHGVALVLPGNFHLRLFIFFLPTPQFLCSGKGCA
jgi:hypothetical protein